MVLKKSEKKKQKKEICKLIFADKKYNQDTLRNLDSKFLKRPTVSIAVYSEYSKDDLKKLEKIFSFLEEQKKKTTIKCTIKSGKRKKKIQKLNIEEYLNLVNKTKKNIEKEKEAEKEAEAEEARKIEQAMKAKQRKDYLTKQIGKVEENILEKKFNILYNAVEECVRIKNIIKEKNLPGTLNYEYKDKKLFITVGEKDENLLYGSCECINNHKGTTETIDYEYVDGIFSRCTSGNTGHGTDPCGSQGGTPTKVLRKEFADLLKNNYGLIYVGDKQVTSVKKYSYA